MHFSGLQRRKMQFARICHAEQMPKPGRKASFRAKHTGRGWNYLYINSCHILAMSRILSVIGMVLGIVLGLKYFGFYDVGSGVGFDIAFIGAVYLVCIQLYYWVIQHFENKGTPASSGIIKLVLIFPGLLYIVQALFAIDLAFDLTIIIAAILFLEGLYGMH